MNELDEAIHLAMVAMLIKFNNRLNKSQMEPESKLSDWADFLAFEKHFTVSQVAFALTELTKKNTTFMPSAYEIADVLAPKETKIQDLAPVIVTEMLSLLRSYSQYSEKDMIEKASENAKLAFYALGSTQDIRLSENIETTKAQLERLVKGVLAAKENKSHHEQLLKIGITPINKKVEFRTMDFSAYLPDEPA